MEDGHLLASMQKKRLLIGKLYFIYLRENENKNYFYIAIYKKYKFAGKILDNKYGIWNN